MVVFELSLNRPFQLSSWSRSGWKVCGGCWGGEHMATMSISNTSCFRVALSWVELRWVLTINVFINVYMNIYMDFHKNVYLAHTNVHMNVQMNVHIWMFIYECSYMNVHIWMFIYECSYMNVHINIHNNVPLVHLNV